MKAEDGGAEAHFLRGLELADREQWEEAIGAFDAALAADAAFGDATYQRALAKRALGRFEEALGDCLALIRRAPRDTAALLLAARIAAFDRGNPKLGLQYATEAVQLAPSAEAHVCRALANEACDLNWQAREDYDAAVRLDPSYAPAWQNRALLRNRLGDEVGARADVDEAIRLDPAEPDAWNLRATLRAAAGDKAGAEADFDELLRRLDDPGDVADALWRRASVRADLEAAIADLVRALELAPPDWPWRDELERDLAVARGDG